nr:Mariner Mos1 transposase [Hymenolepis microstoma]
MRLSRAQGKGKRPQYNERHDKVVILHHDNARPHEMGQSGEKISRNVEMRNLPHPPYSLDVASSHLFTHPSQWHTAWLTSISARMKK